MMVWVMAEATCEVATVCHDAASIRINARGLCTCLQVHTCNSMHVYAHSVARNRSYVRG